MKGILSRFSKKTLLGFGVGLITIASVSGLALAWGPDRPTYTVANPADHVTFDSITDNPNYGDERTFFDGKNSTNTSTGGFVDNVNVADGEEVLLRVYVHNNAASNLNTVSDGNGGFVGIATGTNVRVFLPTASATSLRANAYINATNAVPQSVFDTVDFTAAQPFTLSYVPNSAEIVNNAHPQGTPVDNSIVTTGAPVGYDTNNGVYPGCFQYTAYVTVKAKVTFTQPEKKPDYTIAKTVRLDGQGPNDWVESVTANPGQTVQWRIFINNVGQTQLDHVMMVDQIPAGLKVVPGSVYIKDGNNPNGFYFDASAVQANGTQLNIDTGSYSPGGGAYLYFKTTVPAESAIGCGTNTYVNNAFATPQGMGAVNDTAQVVVNKTCVTTTSTPPTTTTTAPKSLPNTGSDAGAVAGIFTATTAAGATLHRKFLSRKLSR